MTRRAIICAARRISPYALGYRKPALYHGRQEGMSMCAIGVRAIKRKRDEMSYEVVFKDAQGEETVWEYVQGHVNGPMADEECERVWPDHVQTDFPRGLFMRNFAWEAIHDACADFEAHGQAEELLYDVQGALDALAAKKKWIYDDYGVVSMHMALVVDGEEIMDEVVQIDG